MSVHDPDVLMATPQAAGFLSDASERQIFRLIEGNYLHFTENDRVLICMDSLRQINEKRKA
jgi:hypothetical protein